MVEPTERETLEEIDRFIHVMIAICAEIPKVERGEWPQDDNPLKIETDEGLTGIGDATLNGRGEVIGHGVEIDETLAAKYPYQRAYLPVNRLAHDGTLWNW